MFSNSVFNKIDIDENATRALGKSIPVIWSDAIYSIIRVTLTCVILFIIISWALEKFIKLEEGLDIQFYSLCYEIICSIEEGEL